MASWRLTFVIVGLPGVLFALLAWTIREPVRRNLLASADGRATQLSFGEAVAQIRLRWQSVAGISLGMVCQGMITYGLLAWIPTFFQRVHHWSPGQSGRALAAILLTFGCLGMYLGGRLSDYWQKRGVPEGPLKVAVISAIGTLLLMPARDAGSEARMDAGAACAGPVLRCAGDGDFGRGAPAHLSESGPRAGIGAVSVHS